MTDLVGEIASASNEQAMGIGQVSKALTQIDAVNQSNTASSEQCAAAAQELSHQAAEVKDKLSRFRLAADAGTAESPQQALTIVDAEAEDSPSWANYEQEAQ